MGLRRANGGGHKKQEVAGLMTVPMSAVSQWKSGPATPEKSGWTICLREAPIEAVAGGPGTEWWND